MFNQVRRFSCSVQTPGCRSMLDSPFMPLSCKVSQNRGFANVYKHVEKWLEALYLLGFLAFNGQYWPIFRCAI